MRIAFDAKRAYQNNTGLGHYSRTLLSSLITDFPQHEYHLMAPRVTNMFAPQASNVFVHTPTGIGKTFRSLWRSNWVRRDMQKIGIDLYHGLSHEMPVGLHQMGIRSVVTMHDLIFERYPEQYNAIDVAIYRKKFKYAANHADKLIAISLQTKQDLMDYYKIPDNKIEVCYQACNPGFQQLHSEAQKQTIRKKYSLPETYFLYVGTIIERKNLLNICKALHSIKQEIPLVVIGGGNDTYYKKVREYVAVNNLADKVIFLTDNTVAQQDENFKNARDFPAIYQSALAMIYPSVFEGFGLPVLEALWSRTPVITSNISCLPETGGDAAYYVDPYSVEEIALAMQTVSADEVLTAQMQAKGIAHAQNFLPSVCVAKVMEVYTGLI